MCHCEPVTDVTGVAIRSLFDLCEGITDCHSQCAHWSRNDTLQELRYKPGRADVGIAPYKILSKKPP